MGYDEDTARCLVQVLPDGEMKSFKLENLLVVDGALDESTNADGSSFDSASMHSGCAGERSDEKPEASQSGGSPGSGADGQWMPGGEEADIAEAFKTSMPLVHDTL